MKPVQRSEILDFVTYEEQREQIRAASLAAKELRRIEVSEHFTFLFENHDTVRYQVLEMVRIERIVKEADILHELQTYNELLHDSGQLSCTFLIGIDDEVDRDQKLRAWLGLNEHIYATLPDDRRVRPTWDARQVGEDRLSSVQYLTFEFGADAPVALGIDWTGLEAETTLTPEQRAALQEDLGR